MFVATDPPLDAFVLTAERGSAYTLLHPEYSVVVPKPQPLKVPLAYVIAGRDEALAAVVDTWIDLKRKDGTIDELFAHWIQGRDAVPPRAPMVDHGRCTAPEITAQATTASAAIAVPNDARFEVPLAAAVGTPGGFGLDPEAKAVGQQPAELHA